MDHTLALPGLLAEPLENCVAVHLAGTGAVLLHALALSLASLFPALGALIAMRGFVAHGVIAISFSSAWSP